MSKSFQRDAFIEEIRAAAEKDSDIYFISADFGAPALDRFRDELPNQFIHSGISEQHMIDMAAGIALEGKKVYVYAMAPFISLRCLEQIKCSIALMNQPVTVLVVGVGLGYADAGPTHYTTEDIACLRTMIGAEIYSPCDDQSTREIARLTYTQPSFRMIRMERHPLPTIYTSGFSSENLQSGIVELVEGTSVCLLSYGNSLHRTLEAQKELEKEGIKAGVVDVFRTVPVSPELLGVIEKYDSVITVEEQCLAGGFGSIILELLADNRVLKPVYRIGLEERYYFMNGGRKYLLDRFGLSVEAICEAVKQSSLNQQDSLPH